MAEDLGLVFAIADPAAEPFTVEDALHGAGDEIADFGIADLRPSSTAATTSGR